MFYSANIDEEDRPASLSLARRHRGEESTGPYPSMQASNVIGERAVNEIERLVAIEEIKQLKAKYFLGVDTKDWDLWKREVWAPDARVEPAEFPEGFDGIDRIIEWISSQMAPTISVHHGHMPIIDIIDDTNAKGIWAMEDRIYSPREQPLNGDIHYLHGFGHYHDHIVKLDCGWRIKDVRITRLRVELERQV